MATKRKPVPEVRADGNAATRDPEPIEVTNLACPRCDANLHYTPAAWLYCPRCTTLPKLGTGK